MPSRAPTFLRVKAQVLPCSHKALHDLPPFPLCPPLLPLSPSLTLLQTHGPPSCSSNTPGPVLPRAFAQAVPSARNSLPPVLCMSSSFSRSQFKCHLLRDILPDIIS
uniref:Uncharacterized protein n=1 Tax=Sus scrofa TaxID=9823 RepID=A0A4X1VRM1_PIG